MLSICTYIFIIVNYCILIVIHLNQYYGKVDFFISNGENSVLAPGAWKMLGTHSKDCVLE